MADLISVRLTADTGDLQQGLRSASSGVREASGSIRGSLAAIDGAVRSVLAPLAALAASFSAFDALRDAIDATVDYTARSIELSRQLGVTAAEAGVLDTALGDIYVSSGQFSQLATQLLRQLRANEEGFAALGVQTRDAAGNYLSVTQIFANATGVLNSLAEGTNRNVAAQTLFGRGAGEVGAALRLTNQVLDDARAKQESLGLVLTGPVVAAVQRYRAALNDVGDVVQGVGQGVALQLLPQLSALGELIARLGPSIVAVTNGAFAVLGQIVGVVADIIGGLVRIVGEGLAVVLGVDLPRAGAIARDSLNAVLVALQFVRAGIGLLVSAIGGFVNLTLAQLRAWGETAAALLQLDFGAAAEATREGAARIERILAQSRARISASVAELARAGTIRPTSPAATPAPAPPSAAGGFLPFSGGGAARIDLPALNVPRIEPLELIRPSSIEQLRGVIDLLDQVRDASVAGALASVDAQTQAAGQQYQLGVISRQQLLDLDESYESERFAIQQSALQGRLALLATDPTSDPAAAGALRAELQQLEIDHQAALNEIQSQAELQRTEIARSAIDSVSGLIGNSVARLVTLQASFADTIRGLWTGLIGTITQALTQLIGRYIAQRLAALLFERTAKTASAAGQISANAGVAASGAYAATAVIPVIGPILAPAAAATALAGALSFLPLASAARGFDIPANINPVTQLHAREMVLPREQADVIRDLAGGGSPAGGVTINISAVDAQSVGRLFADNREALVGAIRSAVADGIRR